VIILLYGQPGTGKSTLATGMILDALRDNKHVVSNFAVDAAPACLRPDTHLSRGHVEVIPARPSYEELHAIGKGWKTEDDFGREDRSGLLVLDEVGGWINSRSWNTKDRQLIIDWFLHSRKRGWDIIFIAQHPNLIDKQVREAVVEGYARIRRTDRMSIPFLGIKLPRMHIAVARYGLEQNAPKLQSWMYRGGTEQKCFASYALFDSDLDEVCGSYCTLPARITRWKGAKTGKEYRHILNNPPKLLKPKCEWAEKLSRIKNPQERLTHFHKLSALGLI
jgi:hypothetical protein